MGSNNGLPITYTADNNYLNMLPNMNGDMTTNNSCVTLCAIQPQTQPPTYNTQFHQSNQGCHSYCMPRMATGTTVWMPVILSNTNTNNNNSMSNPCFTSQFPPMVSQNNQTALMPWQSVQQ